MASAGEKGVPPGVARVEQLRVKNYRALRDLELKHVTPLTVFLGPNGSGKSTVFDVFAFLAECFDSGVRKAWDRRGRFKELRTRGETGPIEFELKYREAPNQPLITYHLAINEERGRPVVEREWLQWRRGNTGKPFRFLDFAGGGGAVVSGEEPDDTVERMHEDLDSPEALAVNTLGQLARNPRVSALRRFISGWSMSYLTPDQTRTQPEAGPAERLSQTGDNLPNVIQYLKESHPERLDAILSTMRRRIPRLERIEADVMQDGRLLLQIKDAPFARPIHSRFASDGTLKMLAYLTVLYDPDPPPLVGIEEPENQLHPRLLPELTEECQEASDRTQLLITTHSPFLINPLTPEQVWVLYRDSNGHTQAQRTADMAGVPSFIEDGALLGDLWVEGHFDVGDPLSPGPDMPLFHNRRD